MIRMFKKDTSFIMAIAVSVLLHLFWLSIVAVVAPKEPRPIKFSRVSFLGPIAKEAFAPDLGISLPERSPLEKKYLSALKEGTAVAVTPGKQPARLQEMAEASRKERSRAVDTMLTGLIETALSGQRLEPLHGSD